MAGTLILNVADHARGICLPLFLLAREKAKGGITACWRRDWGVGCSFLPGGSSTTNNGPTARPAAACDWARPGGRPFRNISHSRGKPGGAASLPLDCFKVAAPAMDSPNEDGFPSILFCWSVSAASAPGLPRCANADRTEGVCGPLLAEGHAWGSAAWRRSADW